jgi:hypothetical protein
MAPPMVGIAYAYLSWSEIVVKLNHPPGKLEDEPFVRDIIKVPIGIRLTL